MKPLYIIVFLGFICRSLCGASDQSTAAVTDPMAFSEYALQENLSDDEIYLIELLIESARSDYEDDYYSGDWMERNDTREKPGYQPSFPTEHLKPSESALTEKDWFSCQRMSQERPVRDITALQYLPSLTGLALINNEIEDISSLAHCQQLETLYLHGNKIRSIEPLKGSNKLRHLTLAGNQIDDLSPLESIQSLKTLELSADQVPAFRKLKRLPVLKRLEFDLETFDDFEGFPEMPNLRVIRGAHVNSLSGLEQFKNLENLENISGPIHSLKPLSALPELTHVDLYRTSISNLKPLIGLDQLRSIYIETKRHLDLSPLLSLPRLRDVTIKSGRTNHADLESIRKELQHWDIEFYLDKAKATPSLTIEVVDQETFDHYDGQEPYGIPEEHTNQALLESELGWLDEKLEALLAQNLKDGEDYEIPFRWPGARSRTVIIYSQEAAKAFEDIIFGIQKILCRAKNDWIIYFESDYEFEIGKPDFTVWIYPDKIQVTPKDEPAIRDLLNSATIWLEVEEVDDLTQDEFETQIRNFGVLTDTQSERFTEAVWLYTEEDDLSALEALWNGDDHNLANFAFMAYLADLWPEDAIMRVENLSDQEAQLQLGICIGLAANSNEGLEYLIQNIDKFDPKASSVVLQIATGEADKSPQEWKEWWNENGDDFEPVLDELDDSSAMRALIQRRQQAPMQDIFDEMEESMPETAALLGGIFDAMEANRQASISADSNPAIEEAGRLFYFGEIAPAAKGYEEIIATDPSNIYLQYMYASCLFELEQYDEAAKIFEEIADQYPAIESAKYLGLLSRRRIDHPDESLKHAAWSTLLEFEFSEDFDFMGSSDPILSRLHGDRMISKPGVYHRSISELMDRANLSKDPETALGYVLLTPQEGKLERIIEVSSRFPDSTIFAEAELLSKANQSRDTEVILPLIEKCLSNDPTNTYYMIHLAAWKGVDLELVPEELWEAEVDPYYYDCPPLSDGQIKRIREVLKHDRYSSPITNIIAARDRALEEMNHPFRYDSLFMVNRMSDHYAEWKLMDQIKLTAEIAIQRENYELAMELADFLDHLAALKKPHMKSILDRMKISLYDGFSESFRRQSEAKKQSIEYVEEEMDSPERDFVKKYHKIMMPQIVLEYVPIPSLKNIFNTSSTDPEKFVKEYEEFLSASQNTE